MIKAILFDYSGVMTPINIKSQSKKISENFGVTLELARNFILLDGWREFLKGQIDETEYWRKAEAYFGKPITPENRQIFDGLGEMQPLPQMVRFVEELKKTYTVGLISNAIEPSAIALREAGIYDMFDFAIISCEVGYAKPDPEIYNLALEKLEGIKPEEIVFIDDQERCLAPARKLGLKTILSLTPDQVIEDIKRLLF